MELFLENGHLTDEALRAAVDGALDEMGRLEAAEHLSFCDACLVRYTDLVEDDVLLTPSQPLAEGVLERVRRKAVRTIRQRQGRRRPVHGKPYPTLFLKTTSPKLLRRTWSSSEPAWPV